MSVDDEKILRTLKYEEFVRGKCMICGKPGHNEKSCKFDNFSWTQMKTKKLIESGEISWRFLEKLGYYFKPIKDEPEPPTEPVKSVKVKTPKRKAVDMVMVKNIKDKKGNEFTVIEQHQTRSDIVKVRCENWKKGGWSSLCRSCGIRFPISKSSKAWTPFRTTFCKICRERMRLEYIEVMDKNSEKIIAGEKPEQYSFKGVVKDPNQLETRSEYDDESMLLHIPEEFRDNKNIHRNNDGRPSTWQSECLSCGKTFVLTHNKRVWNQKNTNYCSEHRVPGKQVESNSVDLLSISYTLIEIKDFISAAAINILTDMALKEEVDPHYIHKIDSEVRRMVDERLEIIRNQVKTKP